MQVISILFCYNLSLIIFPFTERGKRIRDNRDPTFTCVDRKSEISWIMFYRLQNGLKLLFDDAAKRSAYLRVWNQMRSHLKRFAPGLAERGPNITVQSILKDMLDLCSRPSELRRFENDHP